jgi:hypothetical protein
MYISHLRLVMIQKVSLWELGALLSRHPRNIKESAREDATMVFNQYRCFTAT